MHDLVPSLMTSIILGLIIAVLAQVILTAIRLHMETRVVKPPTYRKMPWLMDLWFRKVRKTPDTWVTTPAGILVSPKLWNSGRWSTPEFLWIRDHEEVHWKRMMNRPWLSRWWWVLHYMKSDAMAYEEEVLAIRRELLHYQSGEERTRHALEAAGNLIQIYGFKQKTVQEIMRDLLAFL